MNYYIPISRRLFEHQLWCEERVFSRFEAWLDILQSARFEDTKQLIGNRLIEVKRGQMLVSLRFLAGRWQWSTKKVNAFLDLLIQDKMIIKETPKETGQTVITICNYDKYNFSTAEEETLRKREGNTKETPRKQEGNKINKEKKEKKEVSVSMGAARAATLKRRDEFYASLVPYVAMYGKEMIRAFFDYWTEMNKSETKMRFEQQPTWETPKRLATWAKREKPKGNRTEQSERDSQQRRINSAVAVATRVQEAAAKRRAELQAEGVID